MPSLDTVTVNPVTCSKAARASPSGPAGISKRRAGSETEPLAVLVRVTSCARATLNVLLPTAEYTTSVPIAAQRYATGQLFLFFCCWRGVLLLILIPLLSLGSDEDRRPYNDGVADLHRLSMRGSSRCFAKRFPWRPVCF